MEGVALLSLRTLHSLHLHCQTEHQPLSQSNTREGVGVPG